MSVLTFIILCLSFSYVKSIFDLGLLDTAKNPFSYLEEKNYPYENHTVTTEDGYILLTVRILHNKKELGDKPRPPVLFVHAIFGTFYDYLNGGPEKALGFLILDEGYDIWLMNTRGNTFGKRHKTLDPSSPAFWNFSWHEVGIYDVPANMDYISNVTGFSNMSIVGHSQGGSIYLALAASKPEYDRRITFSLQLAPVAYLKHATQPIIVMLRNRISYFIFSSIVKKFNLNELFSHHEIYGLLGAKLCFPKSPIIGICSGLFYLLAGPSGQTNTSMISVLGMNDPAGGSAKEILHYIQIAISDKFQLFDYGTQGNLIAYNQKTPPLYNLSTITSPVAIYHGRGDNFISLTDGARLVSQIPNALHFILGRDVNHMDVQWGTKALEQIHMPAIKLLNKFNKMPDHL